MKYIIDANNLAGKLKMLGNKNFDKQLVKMIQNFTKNKTNKIIIVFDPKDEWGDKVAVSNEITVIYSPQDAYYESADDKIAEIIANAGTGSDLSGKDEITVITDDVGLKKRIEKIKEQSGQNINFIRATEYADKLLRALSQSKEDIKEKLSEQEKEKINKELLDIWQ